MRCIILFSSIVCFFSCTHTNNVQGICSNFYDLEKYDLDSILLIKTEGCINDTMNINFQISHEDGVLDDDLELLIFVNDLIYRGKFKSNIELENKQICFGNNDRLSSISFWLINYHEKKIYIFGDKESYVFHDISKFKVKLYKDSNAEVEYIN